MSDAAEPSPVAGTGKGAPPGLFAGAAVVPAAGSIGRVVAIDGARIVGRLHRRSGEAVGDCSSGISCGDLVGIIGGDTRIYGSVSRLWIDETRRESSDGTAMVEIELMGEALAPTNGRSSGFQRGVRKFPALGSAIVPTGADDSELIFARPGGASLVVGAVHHGNEPAHLLTDKLLGGHLAVLGTTGSGKSCTISVLMHTLLQAHPFAHVVILDPHAEYAAAFAGMAEEITTDTLLLPYWLMNFEETVAAFVSNGDGRDAETRILKEAMVACRQEFARAHGKQIHVTVDTPSPYFIKDLRKTISDGMGRLNQPDGAGPYLRLLTRIDALTSDRRYGFMFPDGVVTDDIAQILARLLRLPVGGRPVTTIDLSGLPTEIVDVVVSMLCRLIFEFCLWSPEGERVPVLLVCEEAHRYIARDEGAAFAPTRRALMRIAREGRKYGIGLCLVSQRPSDLSEAVLAQCNTIVALRMTNVHDQEFVARALPDSFAGLLRALPVLHTQEAVVVGEGVAVPTRLRFRDLPPAEQPRSKGAEFSRCWQEDGTNAALARATVERWRAGL